MRVGRRAPRRAAQRQALPVSRQAFDSTSRHHEKELPGLAAYGYVVAPQPQQSKRLNAICKKLTTELDDQGAPASHPASLFVTYWPMKVDPGLHVDCGLAVAEYERERVDPLMDCLQLHGRRGPFLVAQSKALPSGVDTTTQHLVLDLSEVKTADLPAATERWITFTRSEPFRGTLAKVSNYWASIIGYVDHGHFDVGTASWQTCHE